MGLSCPSPLGAQLGFDWSNIHNHNGHESRFRSGQRLEKLKHVMLTLLDDKSERLPHLLTLHYKSKKPGDLVTQSYNRLRA
ncbi:hypothetical protein CUMW_032970 [Citrus unshiu]|nr:hypothetical protein CUMW_032970 [Citrus unshiu]